MISIKKKGQNTTKKKSQSCVKIVKLPMKKILVFFFRSTRIVLRKKILIINIYPAIV